MLRDLRLREFRCFGQLDFAPAPGLNFLIGPNAQGKTSILEAACVLLRLQSPRAGSLAEAVRFGQAGFGLDGHWLDRHLHVKFANSLKAFALDSKPQSRSADFLAVARVAWLSNDDLQLIRGSGATRRRYLDFLGAQVFPNYLRQLRAFERALRSRNALLKDNRPRREIAAFDAPLVESGSAIHRWRAELCDALAPLAHRAAVQISGRDEALSLAYVPGSSPTLADALASNTAEETRLRQTVVGPHRDDVLLCLHERPAAPFASEGQQRSIALALKLAQSQHIEITTGAPPLFLIDDIFGELDTVRRNNLLAALSADAQKLVTSTSLTWLESAPDAMIWRLADGRLTAD